MTTFVFSRCGEDADLGSVHIVAREDIEHQPDFEKFRTYRNIREGGGGTAAYRRPSRASLGGELEGPQFSHGRQSRLRRAGPNRSVRERLRDFLASRAAHSLYIWSPQDRFVVSRSRVSVDCLTAGSVFGVRRCRRREDWTSSS